jgi:2-amino-4-hydroxy-6-hydroxymethyldihydropteridine diphosphokinase
VLSPNGAHPVPAHTAQTAPDPRREPVTAFVALGANLGDAAQTLRDALAALHQAPGVRVLRQSRLYRSAPVDASGPDYVNAVAEICTTCTAPALLHTLQTLENAAGRERPYRNAPRTLDLDVLLYGSARMQSPTLTLPHPRMDGRAFVLLPLAEIAPQFVSATQRQAVAQQAIEPLP